MNYNSLFPYVLLRINKELDPVQINIIKNIMRYVSYYGICDYEINHNLKYYKGEIKEIINNYIFLRRPISPLIKKIKNYDVIITNDEIIEPNCISIYNDDLLKNLSKYFKSKIIFKCIRNNNKYNKEVFNTLYTEILKYSNIVKIFDTQYFVAMKRNYEYIKGKRKDDDKFICYYREGLHWFLSLYKKANIHQIENKLVIILQYNKEKHNVECIKEILEKEKKLFLVYNIDIEFELYQKIPHHRYWLFYIHNSQNRHINKTPFGIITDFGLTDFTQYRSFYSEFYHVETDDYANYLSDGLITRI
jgi:hypothetical protein